MIGKFKNKLNRLYKHLNVSTIEYDLWPYYELLDQIKRYAPELKKKTENQLRQISRELIVQARKGIYLDNLLIKAYALVHESVQRILNLRPFDVQIIGAMAMHQGKLAEMQTGEGKTLAAVFPVYLNALPGNGVHVLTFNDYLARRDAQWMEPVYSFLGLDVGFVQEGMSTSDRRKNYKADITYLTAKESGFDYLRDNLVDNIEDRVHRPFNFALIDEADSILIDEARNPLVIAGASDTHISGLHHMASIARKLEINRDLELDESARNIYLTDNGFKRLEKLLKIENLHALENIDLLTRLNCAIHVEFLLSRDVDYIVRDNKIELVDEFTGRIADRRRWPDGLQAALEAKENLNIQTRGQILNSISLPHFLRRYQKICGMTATAQSAEEEFKQFYNLDIVVIPPNRPCIRVDHHDVVFKTKKERNKAIINEIIKTSQSKRPILVGTSSVEESASLANELQKYNMKCEVLNAKRDEDEAGIIAQAGKLGAITISTNMAGRGTDIRLGGIDEKEKEEVMALGGLYVIGTNKHESQRIDRQLRGRAGRQGDPGSSRFFISLEDDLLMKFGLKDSLPTGIIEEKANGDVSSHYVRSEIEHIQKVIEGQNIEIKKTLFKYSSVVERQREKMAEDREFFLNPENAFDFFKSESPEKLHEYKSILNPEKINLLCKQIIIYSIDRYWSEYLAEIGEIREEIHLQSIGRQVPFFEFQKIAKQLFTEYSMELHKEVTHIFNNIDISEKDIDLELEKLKSPSATWTYIINDNPMEYALGMVGDIGLSTASGATALMIKLFSWIRSCFLKPRLDPNVAENLAQKR